MSIPDDITRTHIATIEDGRRRYNVALRVGFDGVEFVGRLWFADESWDDVGIPDRAAFPGRTKGESIALAMRLTRDEMVKRHRRAHAEKRRYQGLRKATNEILAKIRYLNRVSVSMRSGLLDAEGATQEIELTGQQLKALIDRLATHAGIED
jgi:hypothetical protein